MTLPFATLLTLTLALSATRSETVAALVAVGTWAHPVTAFVHRPHFSIDDPRTCGACHDLSRRSFDAAKEAFEVLYADSNPRGHLSANFEDMTVDLCASCHTSRQAGDRCTSCHNYHIGEFVPLLLTAVEGLAPGDEPTQ